MEQPMTTTNVEETIKERFAEIMHLPGQQIDTDAHLAGEYGVTSLTALKLISEVEVEFDIDINENEARSIKKLNDVIELVAKKLR
jgi:acyl carrier protein